MRVLQVISSYPPAYIYGGPAKIALKISEELSFRGHDVTVFTTDVFNAVSRLRSPVIANASGKVKVHRFRNVSNFLARKNIAVAPGIAGGMMRELQNIDIIHLHEYRSFQAIIACTYARKCRVPYVLQAHGSVLPVLNAEALKRGYDWIWGRTILSNAHKVIALSRVEKQQYEQMGVDASRIELLSNFVECPGSGTASAAEDFKKQMGIPSESRVILYLGRLHRRKGISHLVRAFEGLAGEYPDSFLVIAGPDDGYQREIERLVRDLGLSGRVILPGFVKNAEDAYKSAEVLVYPGIHEIFGLVPFEALLCGTPIIVSAESGCGELVRESGSGLLIEYGNVASISNAIRCVLEKPEYARALVSKGKKHILENLTLRAVVNRLESIYHDSIE